MNKRTVWARLGFFLFVLMLTSRVTFGQDQCVTCHEAIGDEHVVAFMNGVHVAKGLSCADCHGGDRTKEDMEEAMNPSAGFVGVPKGDAISATCARCHSDASIMIKSYNSVVQLDQLQAVTRSVHGKQDLSGTARIVQCTSCHGSHGILSKKDKRSPVHPTNIPSTCASCHSNAGYMFSFSKSIPVDQLQKYRTSVHGKRNARGDAKVAECSSCHGSHEVLSAKDVRSAVYPLNIPETCGSCHSNATYMRGYGIDSDQLEKYSTSVHGIALLEKKDISAPACNDCHGNHGAAPPGVESISKVCGTCHALNADLFSKSPHKAAFDSRGLPECETCHGNHDVVAVTDELLGVGEEAVCSWCHGDDPSSRGYKVAAQFRRLTDSLVTAENGALARIQEAEQKGMEVSEALFKAREIRQARLESRTKVHSFDEVQFSETVLNGLAIAAEVLRMADEAIEEYYFRRWGLLLASFIITVLAISIYLLIVRIEKIQARRKS